MPTAWPIPATGTFVDTAWLNATGARLLGSVSLTAPSASVFLGNFAGLGYKHLCVVWRAREDKASVVNSSLGLQLSGNGLATYYTQAIRCSAASIASGETLAGTQGSCGIIPGPAALTDEFGCGVIWIPNYGDSNLRRSWSAACATWCGTTTGSGFAYMSGGLDTTSGNTSTVTFAPTDGSNLVAGSVFSAYGMG